MAKLFKATRKTMQEISGTFTIAGITITIDGNDDIVIIKTSQDLTPAQRTTLITRLEDNGMRLRFEQ